MAEDGLRFGVLGPLLIERTGERVDPPRSGVLRGLLGVLLVAQGQPLPVDRLIDLVWAEHPNRVRRGAVQVGISRLRDWLATAGAGATVEYDAAGYRLSVAPQAVDLAGFRTRVAEAMASPDPAQRWRSLVAATNLVRGPVLADVAGVDPADPLVRAVRDEVRAAGLAMAQAAIAIGRPAEAIAHIEAMAAAAPIDEPVHALLLELLAAGGRPAEALARYESLRATLAEDLGVSPSADVQRVHLAILAGDGLVAAAAAPDAAPAPAPCLLPPDLIDFTGRAEQVELLVDLLAGTRRAPATPTVVVVGAGGIGKTTLAVHVAHRLRDAFPDGQLYLDLHGAEARPVDPADALARWLITLGVDGRALPDGVDARAERFRTLVAQRRMLVVLDDAHSARQIRPLLPGGSRCAVLVTSRRRLPELSARTLRLTELDQDSALAMFTEIVGSRRASAEPAAAVRIVELCGRLPLAVRIAGARLAARTQWTLARLVDRLGEERRRLDELTVGDLTVRASLAMSYGTLDTRTRRAFRLLGLLDAADFPVWACAALLDTGTEEAEARLDALVDAQLLDCVGTDASGQFRYRFHDLVRLYAWEHAEEVEHAGQRASALTRALGAWLAMAGVADQALAERVASDIRGGAPRWLPDAAAVRRPAEDALAWFDSERAALSACVAQAGRIGLDETAWELAAHAVNFYAFRGLYEDWSQTHNLARQACARADNHRGAAVMVRNLACLRMTGVKTASSRGVLAGMADALRTFQRCGDRHAEVDMLGFCALALRQRGELERGDALCDNGMALAEATGYDLGKCRLWYLRAVVNREQGRYVAAAECASRCLELASQAGTAHDRVLALWELAAACRDPRALGQVSGRLLDGMTVCRARGERLLEAYLLLALGDLRFRFGQPGTRGHIERALAVFEEHKALFGQDLGLRLLGQLDESPAPLATTPSAR